MRCQNVLKMQREGRAIRQGNQNPEVAIARYVTEGSFDVFCWQTVERKAAFINQVMSGDVAGREIDDVGDTALSYAEVKALATGNPLILEKAGVDNELTRLLRLRQAHDRDQTGLSRTLAGSASTVTRLEAEIGTLEVAVDARRSTGGETFAMTVDGTRHTKRPEAGSHLRTILAQELHRQQGHERPLPGRVVGELGGLALELTTRRDFGGTAEALVRIGTTPVHLRLTAADLGATDALGLVSRLENRVRGLDVTLETARADLRRTNREAAAARARLGAPFPHEERLATLRARQAEIEAALLPCAMNVEGSRAVEGGLKRCCIGDGGGPSAAALQGEAANHRKVRRLRAGVLSVAGKGETRARQVESQEGERERTPDDVSKCRR